MKVFLMSYQIELEKIFRRKKYWVLTVIQLIIYAVIMAVAVFNARLTNQGITDFISYGILNVINHLVAPLMAFMLVADLFPQEFENTSVKTIFMRPITRTKIFMSKVLVIPTFMLVNLVLAGIIVSALNLAGGFSISINTIAAYVLSVIPVFAFAALGTFIALLVNSSTLSMFLNLIIYVAMVGVRFLNPVWAATLFTNHLNFYRVLIDNPLRATNTLLMFASTFVFLSIIGLVLFERKEV